MSNADNPEVQKLLAYVDENIRPIVIDEGVEDEFNIWLDKSIDRIVNDNMSCTDILAEELTNLRIEAIRRAENN